jgi:methyl-accepting chemotaxis protein
LIGESIDSAKKGAEIAKETASSLDAIVCEVKKCAALNSEITRSTDAQADDIAQLYKTLEEINRVVRQNNETVAKSAGESKDVSGQSARLQGLLSQFKIKDGADALPGAK